MVIKDLEKTPELSTGLPEKYRNLGFVLPESPANILDLQKHFAKNQLATVNQCDGETRHCQVNEIQQAYAALMHDLGNTVQALECHLSLGLNSPEDLDDLKAITGRLRNSLNLTLIGTVQDLRGHLTKERLPITSKLNSIAKQAKLAVLIQNAKYSPNCGSSRAFHSRSGESLF